MRWPCYKNILVAIELTEKTNMEILARARLMAKEYGAEITLVHAVEYAGSYNIYGMGVGFEIEKSLVDNSTKAMQELGARIGIASNKLIVRSGSAKYVILEEADRIQSDLIVVGSHGRNGVRAILGSTANAVLHGAKIDVLSIRIKG